MYRFIFNPDVMCPMIKRCVFNFVVVPASFFIMAGTIHADTLNTYHIGNSLTWDARVSAGLPQLAADAGHTLTTGYHIRCGRSLDYILNNPTDVCIESNTLGYYEEALANYAWDAITLQPHTSATAREEYEAAKALIQLARQNPDNADTRFYMFASWGEKPFTGTLFYDDWYDPTPTDPDANMVRNANSFEWIYNELKNDPDLQDIDLYVIPVGYVMAEIDLRMDAGEFSDFFSAVQLYRDNLHLNNLGRFIAATTVFATLFEEDPTGLPASDDFQPGSLPTGTPASTEQLTLVDQVTLTTSPCVACDTDADTSTDLLPGDLDLDGFVGIDDLDIVLTSWNQVTLWSNGIVGLDELEYVLGNWGEGTPTIGIPITEELALLVQDAVWDVVSSFPNALTVSLVGDLDGDGFVGLDDLDIVLGEWGQATSWSDGDVGLDELDLVLNHWGEGTPPSISELSIPEPSVLGIGIVTGLTMIGTRRTSDTGRRGR